MNEDLSAIDATQLARWAYSSVATPSEAERAHGAALELQRRATDARANAAGVRRSSSPTSGPIRTEAAHRVGATVAADAPAVDAEPGVDEPRRPNDRRWRWQWTIAGVAATALLSGMLVAGVTFGQTLLQLPPTPPLSLDVFDRTASAEELALVGQFERDGQRVTIGPRILDSVGFGSVVAFRSILSSSGVAEPALDLVCVAATEFNPRAQTTAIADPVCVARAVFEMRGVEATLFGLGGQYDVVWGPVGRAQVDVTISDAQRDFMEPGFETAFFEKSDTDLDRLYLDDPRLTEQTGLTITRVRTIFPTAFLTGQQENISIDNLTTDVEWVAIYTGTALDSGDEFACIAVLANGVQGEHTCRLVDEIGVRGLLLEIERESITIIVSWSERGEISAQTVRNQ